MIPQQRFFERTDGSTQALAYGYSRLHDEAEWTVTGIAEKLGVPFAGMFCEPASLGIKNKPFLMRPVGRELSGKLQPGDHVIVPRLFSLPSHLNNLGGTMRWFIERGVQLHVAELANAGISISMEAVTIISELNRNLLSESARDGHQRALATKEHTRGPIPTFCRIINRPGKKRAGKMELQDWAIPMFERIVDLHENKGLGWFEMHGEIWREFHQYGIKMPHPTSYEKYYDFYKGWLELGKPDINVISYGQVRDNYNKKRRQEEMQWRIIQGLGERSREPATAGQPLPEDGCL